MSIAAILGLVSAGAAIADEFIDDDSKVGKWVKLGQLAAKGIASAVAAVEKLNGWRDSGHQPSNDELDALLAINHEKSSIIQNHD